MVFQLWFAKKVPKRVAVVATTATSTVAAAMVRNLILISSRLFLCVVSLFCQVCVCGCVYVFSLCCSYFLVNCWRWILIIAFRLWVLWLFRFRRRRISRSLRFDLFNIDSMKWWLYYENTLRCCCWFFFSLEWKDITCIQSHFIRI